MKSILYSILFLLLTPSLMAQTGTVRGKVISAGTGEALIGATVILKGTQNGASTDMDGRFSLDEVPEGEQDIVCRYFSYRNDTIENIDVKAGEVTSLDISLRESQMETQAVEIQARKERGGEVHMMTMKRRSSRVMDGISAESMSRSGAGDAAEAAKKVTGVSVQGGKYIYVRGLSDRYSKAMLNGMELPGLDPNRNSVQMDLFPSNILENMAIVKSFSPELPANFTGGLVDLRTKDLPEKFSFEYSSSIGFNPQANLRDDFLAPRKRDKDVIAMGAESRQVPQAVQNREVPGGLFENDELLGSQTRSFSKDFTPVRRHSGLDHSHSISVGDQEKLFGNKLGFVAGLSYSKGFDYYNGGERNIYSLPGPGNKKEGLNEEKLFSDERGQENVQWGAIANATYKFSSRHKLKALFLRNQSGNSKGRMLQGPIPEDNQNRNYRFRTRTQSYRQRSVQSFQFGGEHIFPDLADLDLEWKLARSRSTQKTPDLSYFSNTFVLSGTGNGESPDTNYSINPAEYSEPMRFYRSMEEQNTDLKVDLNLPLKIRSRDAEVKAGISRTSKKRGFKQERYNFSSYSTSYSGNPSQYFSDANMRVGDYQKGFVYMQDASALRNDYSGEQVIEAAYALIDMRPLKGLRVNVGGRVERTDIRTRSGDPELPKGSIDRTDFLPSINLTYSLQEKMNLRTGYSRTIARPSFREFAPFPSFDFTGGLIRTGNEKLDRTLIDNYDLRWELFPNPGEIITASVFAKDFHQPIERVTKPTAAHTEITWQNVDRAFLYGAEIEARKSLAFIDSTLENFKAGANFTYIESEVAISEQRMKELRAYDPDHPETRDMYGQAPYIINGFINYENEELGLNANLSYNMTGPRMVIVSQGGTPNVYDQPNPRLDLKLGKELGDRFSIDLQVQNILNPADERTQRFAGEQYIFSSYRSGRRYSLGVSYKIGG